MYGSHYKIIGKFIKRNITTKVILVKMTTQGDMKRNVRKAKENRPVAVAVVMAKVEGTTRRICPARKHLAIAPL